MTKQDDWTRFCEMMAAAGWGYDAEKDCFTFLNAVYEPNGKFFIGGDQMTQPLIGWRVWLEAGQTPAPF